VPRREPIKAQSLEVTVQFEPNRLAEEYLADAYERIVPIRRRRINTSSDIQPPKPHEGQCQKGGSRA